MSATDVQTCGALADSSTPEWARGKVACERPRKRRDGCGGPHSARVTPPGSTAPVTLTWAIDARPAPEEPASDDAEPAAEPSEAAEPKVVGSESVLGLVAQAIASGNAALEARVLGHEEDGEFIVDEVVEVLGVSFSRPGRG